MQKLNQQQEEKILNLMNLQNLKPMQKRGYIRNNYIDFNLNQDISIRLFYDDRNKNKSQGGFLIDGVAFESTPAFEKKVSELVQEYNDNWSKKNDEIVERKKNEISNVFSAIDKL